MVAPFTSTGTYTGGALVKAAVAPGFVEGVFKNSEVLPVFPAPVGSPGDTAYRWKIHSAANASPEVFTEGADLPEADSQEWVTGAVSYVYFAGTTQISGHARDAMRSSYLPQALDLELTMLRDDMIDLISRTWLGSTYGLELAVDSTSTYAGLTRGSLTAFESKETAVSAIVSFTDMIDMLEALRNAEYAANPNAILCNWNQLTRLYSITGQPAIKQLGSDRDAAPGYTGVSFAGIPVRAVRDMTTTIILFLDTSKFANVVHREFQVDERRSGDSDVFHLTFANALVCREPMKQGKLTGCTA